MSLCEAGDGSYIVGRFLARGLFPTRRRYGVCLIASSRNGRQNRLRSTAVFRDFWTLFDEPLRDDVLSSLIEGSPKKALEGMTKRFGCS